MNMKINSNNMIANTNLQYQANDSVLQPHNTSSGANPSFARLTELIGYRYGNRCNKDASKSFEQDNWSWEFLKSQGCGAHSKTDQCYTCFLSLPHLFLLMTWGPGPLFACLVWLQQGEIIFSPFYLAIWSDMIQKQKWSLNQFYFYNQVLRPHGIDPLPFSYSVPIYMLTSATSSKKICRKKPRAVAVIWYGAPPIAKHTLLHTVRALFLSSCGESWKEDKKEVTKRWTMTVIVASKTRAMRDRWTFHRKRTW